VICYAIDDRTSFENVEKKWKPEILRFGDGPSVPIILAGLKSDLRKDTKDFVSFEEGEELQTRIGAAHFLECCTHNTVKNVETVLQLMVECAANKKSEEEKPTSIN
jgi:GTPase SAR1 family protein